MTMFFTGKNILVVLIQLYRLVVICYDASKNRTDQCEHDQDEKHGEQEAPLCHQSDSTTVNIEAK